MMRRTPLHTIRAATTADEAALAELYAAVMRVASWRKTPETARFADVSRDESVWVCVVDEALVGVMSIYEPDFFVHHLYVHPDFQRRGIGKALLKSLATWLPAPWRLKCVLANTTALAFYKALGWRQMGRGNDEQGTYAILEYRPA